MLAEEGLTVIEEEERMMTDSGGQFCFAHNGWVMDADPMVNFAEPGQSCYSVVFLIVRLPTCTVGAAVHCTSNMNVVLISLGMRLGTRVVQVGLGSHVVDLVQCGA